MYPEIQSLRNVLYELLVSDNDNGDDIKLSQNMNTAITSNSFRKIMTENNAKVIQIQNQSISKSINKNVVNALRIVDTIQSKDKQIKVEVLVRDFILMDIPYNEMIDFITRSYLKELLKLTNESQTDLADRIGMKRGAFLALLDKHGMRNRKQVKEIEE